jgi:hypothetical protein
MLPRDVRPLLILGLSLAATGCAQTFDATTLGVEATMASSATAPAQGEAFEVSKKAVYLVWGALAANKPSLQKILASQVTGDARVADLRVKVRSRWSDVLISVLTVGLVVPRTVTFEGVIVGQ